MIVCYIIIIQALQGYHHEHIYTYIYITHTSCIVLTTGPIKPFGLIDVLGTGKGFVFLNARVVNSSRD